MTAATDRRSDLEVALLFQIRAAGLPEPVLQYRAVPGRRWRWDFAWPEYNVSLIGRIARTGEELSRMSVAANQGRTYWTEYPKLLVEVDGATWTAGRHTRGQGYENDCLKQSTAAALGWRTMRFTRQLIESGRAVELIEQAL